MIRSIDERACVGCAICELICPADVIVMDADNKARIQYRLDCWTCFSCELACPVRAIDVHPFRKKRPMAW